MSLTKRFRVWPLWEGKTVIVVGSGPSLDTKTVRRIAMARMAPSDDVRVIAVNDAIYPCWFADWLHACDYIWWREHIFYVHTFPGIKTSLENDIPAPWVTGHLKNTGVEGFDDDPSCCRNGRNSGFQAIHIAIHAGASKIVLAGIDIKKADDGSSHFFGEHVYDGVPNYRSAMLPHFGTLLPEMERRGIECVNTSMESAVEVFPKLEIERALA